VDKLHAVDLQVTRTLEADHASASQAFERSTWASGIAAGLSLILMLVGITIILAAVGLPRAGKTCRRSVLRAIPT